MKNKKRNLGPATSFNYEPAPFWFLNHKLEKTEIRRQIRLMKKAGVSGFFMHPRAGLLTPYGSSEWYTMLGTIIQEAKKQGVNAWLYDDDPFPSGIAGGKVIFDNPEFAARRINIIKLQPDKKGMIDSQLGRGRILSAVAIRRNREGKVVEERDISAEIGIIRPFYLKAEWNSAYFAEMYGKVKYPHFRAETFFAQNHIKLKLAGKVWTVFVSSAETVRCGDKHGFKADNLSKESVKAYIKCTHEKYKECFGDEFGKTVPGIFVDEPSAGGTPPWTPEFEKAFLDKKGYDIRNLYHHLAENINWRSRQIRFDYWDVINQMYLDNFFKPISEWCRSNSISFCGHVICEEDPINQIWSGGNVLSYQKYFDIPGFDHVTPNIADRQYPTLNFGGKLISSSAHQQGKETVLSECFACNAFNFNRDGMEKVANWLFALGVTWLVPHGFYYSYDGDRKFDAGKSFFFQDPKFPEFEDFAKYAERIGKKLAKSKHISNTCLLYPFQLFMELIPAEEELAIKLRKQLYRCVRILLENHIEFDIIDDSGLSAPLRDGKIVCGGESYVNIVVPALATELSERYDAKLAELRKSISVNVLDPDNESSVDTDGHEHVAISALPSGVKSRESDVKNLMSLKKITKDGHVLVYIFNNSCEPCEFSIPVPENFGNAYLYDADSDKYYGMDFRNERLYWAIGGFKALMFEFSNKKIPAAVPTGTLEVPELKTALLEYERKPQWDYMPPGEWIAAIHKWDISINAGKKTKRFKNHPYCLARGLAGTEHKYLQEGVPVPWFDRAESIKSAYPVKMSCEAGFELSGTAGKDQILLVCENDTFQGRCKIFVNGKELPMDLFQRKTIYDPFNLVADVSCFLKTGNNTFRLEWASAGEFDGIKSSLYLMSSNKVDERHR